jgi:isopentenyl diphosphate isomerase/L-lactate dehydrogenase-like FMN-dependent dehydrogenase
VGGAAARAARRLQGGHPDRRCDRPGFLGRLRPPGPEQALAPLRHFPERTANLFKTDLSWADLEFTANASGLPVIVKGLARPDDAVAAAKAGVAAIQVSNHGGRALDGTPASITVLPEIAEAVQGDVPIILDSGIRRGTDVAKALALGADAAAVGRPVWWSLALGGAGGVSGLINHFRRELVDAMLHLGVRARRSGTSRYGASARECGDVPDRV